MAGKEEFKPPGWFQEWRDPKDFFREAQRITTQTPAGEIFHDPEYQFAFDAYGAGKFALIYSVEIPCLVRCLPDEYPDFALKIGDESLEFELTEADREGRKRGDEYRDQAEREAAGLSPELEMFDPGDEVQDAYIAIERLVALKASKLYSPQVGLAVLVNFSSFDKSTIEWDKIRSKTKPFRSDFPAIWVLWGNRLFQCWPEARTIIAPSVVGEYL